jgi:hypothetical protein
MSARLAPGGSEPEAKPPHRFTCYVRQPNGRLPKVIPVGLPQISDSPLTKDGWVLVVGASFPLPWLVDELHRLAESLDQWEVPAPADWSAIHAEDPEKGGAA